MIKISHCASLLLLVIICGSDAMPKILLHEVRDMVDEIAANELFINNIFKPSKNGYLGVGGLSFAYNGTLITDKLHKQVAMKFTPPLLKFTAEKEYQMYTYLNAINNETVEVYGVPCVYYRGVWNDHYLMAITLLDSEFKRHADAGKLNELDLLIICREFVRISKYIHSCGVCQDDFKLFHIMFRRNNGFIIDFNQASKMYTARQLRGLSLSQRQVWEDTRRKQDWQSFLYAICNFIGVKLEQFGLDAPDKTKNDVLNNIKKIEGIKHDGLRRVLVVFAIRVFEVNIQDNDYSKRTAKRGQLNEASKISFYDQMYQIINVEIGKYQKEEPALVSWLTEQQKNEAKQELAENKIPSILPLNDFFGIVEPNYPVVDVNFFQTLYPASESSNLSGLNANN